MKKISIFDQKNDKKVLEDYLEVDRNDFEALNEYKVYSESLKLTDSRVGKKTMLEWFSIGNLSLWWFIFPTLDPKFNEAALFLDRLYVLVEENKPNQLQLNGSYDKISLVRNFCHQKNIKLKISIPGYLSFLLKKNIRSFLRKYAYTKITKKKHHKRLEIFKKSKKQLNLEPHSVIITSPDVYRRKVPDFNTGKQKNEEFFIHPILDLLNSEKKSFVCIDLDYTLRGRTNSLIERINSKNNWIPIEYIFQDINTNYHKDTISKLKNSVKEMKKNNLAEIFSYRDISLWEHIEPFFDEIFYEPYIPTYLRTITGVEKFLRKFNPSLIIQVYETGPYAKSFEVAAKNLKIKTVGVVHGGMVNSTQNDYLHKNLNENYPLGNPIPDLTLLFGEYQKRIFTELGFYPQNSIAITGNPTLHNFDKIKKNLSKEKLLSIYKISDKKIILMALSFKIHFQKLSNIDLSILHILYSNFKDDENTIIIVRPHPGDTFNQKDLDKLYPSKNFICSKCSIFEDLFLSDIVLVTLSTVGIEAALFNKPTLYVASTLHDTNNLKSISSTIINNDLAELVSLTNFIERINSIKKGELWDINRSEKRKFFLSQYLFNSQKLAEVLKPLIT